MASNAEADEEVYRRTEKIESRRMRINVMLETKVLMRCKLAGNGDEIERSKSLNRQRACSEISLWCRCLFIASRHDFAEPHPQTVVFRTVDGI
jgi:hypothetical protein